MKKQNKISTRLLILASAILGLLFLFPLWKITLSAPQYPNPLVMSIWINKISGTTENTLQSINILNHYIGMAPILPQSFPELSYMPWIVICLIFSGLLTALSHKRPLLAIWVVLLVGLGSLGLWDFYHWEQEFGHNLNPRAPIKLDDMTYSPPFLGKKVLLNIRATSMPAMGAIVLFLSIGLALLAVITDIFNHSKSSINRVKSFHIMRPSTHFGISVILISLLGTLDSCNIQPKPINYGNEVCEWCQMTITDQHYGTEFVTNKGKVHKFDSIECLLHYLKKNNIQTNNLHNVLVTDFEHPGKFIPASEAIYLNCKKLPSPMGASLTAFKSGKAAAKVKADQGGRLLSWDETGTLIGK